jgi:hypothetical protein
MNKHMNMVAITASFANEDDPTTFYSFKGHYLLGIFSCKEEHSKLKTGMASIIEELRTFVTDKVELVAAGTDHAYRVVSLIISGMIVISSKHVTHPSLILLSKFHHPSYNLLSPIRCMHIFRRSQISSLPSWAVH